MEPLLRWFRGRQPQLLGQRFAVAGEPELLMELKQGPLALGGRPPLRWAQLVERVQWLVRLQGWGVQREPELLLPQSLGWEDWQGLQAGRCLGPVWPG